MNSNSNYKPDFIIIGGMKCATSTLHDQLNRHDSFFMTNPKEPNFFSDDDIYANGLEWYSSLFAGASPGQLKGESSTHYTKLPTYPETVDRILAYCPDIRCIYMMRHPVDRLVSHYIHEWSQGVISCDIDAAVVRYPELVEYGRYNMQIAPYLQKCGQSAMLPLFVERIRENPLRELQTVFEFLGITEKPQWHEEIRSNVSSERLRVCGWRDAIVNNYVLRFLRRTFVPKPIRRKIRKLWTMQEKPKLSPETLHHVESIFDEDLELLGTKIGMQLSCGNFKEKITSKESSPAWAI